MYIIEQFKVIFWKNWKIFKRSSILFPLSEILVTATVVSSIGMKIAPLFIYLFYFILFF